MDILKQKIYEHCCLTLQQKIAMLHQKQEDLNESLRQETKSTAGDKYETGRAMVHIEQEQVAAQLATLQQQKAALESLDWSHVQEQVRAGSLVETDKGHFFLSIALGKIMIDGHTAFALSPQSPLGQQLIGHRHGDIIVFNGQHYTIVAVG